MNVKISTSIFLCWMLLAGCGRGGDQQKSHAKPNFLFILADDLGAHDLSSTGSKYYETPNIDRIAAQAMQFTNGYAACQVCSPSRASIMLGQFPARHGITDWIGASAGKAWHKHGRFNKLLPPDYVRNLPAKDTTLAEALHAAGYKTFFAGKWHLGSKGSWPEDHGFDINIGGWDAGSPKGGYFSPFANPNLPNVKAGENLSMRLANETAKFLRENNPQVTGKPFFAYLAFYAVHGPIQTSKDKWAKYREKADEMGLADHGYEMGHFFPIRQVQDNPIYAGLVETMDDGVGVVLNELDVLGLTDNTVVVFTSDNGGVAAGDSYSTSNLPLQAGKGYQYEGGIREPYFIKIPWMTKQGDQNSTPVSGTDFYPTFLQLAGLPLRPAQHRDGVSLLPLLQGDTIAQRPLIWHYPHYGNQGGEPSSIIRLGDWKLIYYHEDGHDELFNLRQDPGEHHDVASQNAERVQALHNELMDYLQTVGAKFPLKDSEYDSAREAEHMKWVKEVLWPRLESNRLKYLEQDYEPGNDWWGSQTAD